MKSTKVNKSTPLGGRVWSMIFLFGLIGQLAWVVENVYFSTFIQKQITTDVRATSATVAASAIVAAIATILGGAMSDRVGKRRPFICYGYVIWGAITAAFAIFGNNAFSPEFDKIWLIVSIFVIMDCFMTFFGSVANDAAFSAWISDTTNITNRGFVDTVLSIFPVVALIVVLVGFSAMTEAGNWTTFFLIIGGVTVIAGIVGIFVFRDSPTIVRDSARMSFKETMYGFLPSTFKQNKMIYVCYLGMLFSGLSMQLWQPEMIMLIQYTIGLEDFVPPLVVVILASATIAIIVGKLMDKYGKDKFFYPLVISGFLGGLIVYSIKFFGASFGARFALFCIGGTMVESASLLAAGLFTASARDYIPRGKSGRFQGVKIIICVTMPMVISAIVSPLIVDGFGKITEVDFGSYHAGDVVYPFELFLFAAIAALLMIIPAIFVKKNHKVFREEKLKEINGQ